MNILPLLNISGLKRYVAVEVPDALGKTLVRNNWAEKLEDPKPEPRPEKARGQEAPPVVQDVPGEPALEAPKAEVLPDPS